MFINSVGHPAFFFTMKSLSCMTDTIFYHFTSVQRIILSKKFHCLNKGFSEPRDVDLQILPINIHIPSSIIPLQEYRLGIFNDRIIWTIGT